MRHILLAPGADVAGFRRAARGLIAAAVPPEAVQWGSAESGDLFACQAAGSESETASARDTRPPPPLTLARVAADLIRLVICHRDPERYALLYRLVWRLLHGEPALLEVPSDPLIHRLELLRRAVARDLHKMHAFLRFRRLAAPDGSERYIAWFEPDHFILEETAAFFVHRFRGMAWSILTPLGALHWDGESLRHGPPLLRAAAPQGDDFEAGWATYYESTFNPARVNTGQMRKEMPIKYWRNLPETREIARLVQGAPARVRAMIEQEAAMPAKREPIKAVAAMSRQEPESLEALNRIIASAEPLVPGATRAVLGEGPLSAAIAFVGEQPGDQEDLAGRPFVGPAGQVLDAAMRQAGIDRGACYLTNAVKHFKFIRQGKRRIHQKPTAGEVKHYRWWLMRELGFVRPGLIVALGATAALALTGKSVPVSRARGAARFEDWPGFITVHPSYLLRIPESAARQEAEAAFLDDLRAIAALAQPA